VRAVIEENEKDVVTTTSASSLRDRDCPQGAYASTLIFQQKDRRRVGLPEPGR
jgi:hypothetical protein